MNAVVRHGPGIYPSWKYGFQILNISPVDSSLSLLLVLALASSK